MSQSRLSLDKSWKVAVEQRFAGRKARNEARRSLESLWTRSMQDGGGAASLEAEHHGTAFNALN